MGGKGGSATVGYRYYMGLHAGICHGPVDALVEIRGGNISFDTPGAATQTPTFIALGGLIPEGFGELDPYVPIFPVTASGEVYINQPNLYGGDKKEGGVQGYLDVMMGEVTQGVNSYLASVQGGIQNAYRGLMTCVFRGGLIGSNNPYPKPWSFRVQRTTMGWDGGVCWYAEKAPIYLGSFNAAQMTWKYKITTHSDGTNYSSQSFDDSSWPSSYFPLGNKFNTHSPAPSNYGFSDEPATVIPDPSRTWVRGNISLGSVPGMIRLQAYVDDTSYFYVNGVLIYSVNTAEEHLAQYIDVEIPSTAFRTGDNLFAAQIIGVDSSGDGDNYVWLDFRFPNLNSIVAMNPAHIVYEVLTNRDWGMGYPSSIIDTTAFQASADQHFAEGLGLCLAWNREDTVQNFLQTIMDYTGGVLVQSKTTGLFQYNLIRGGYDPTTLPVFTRDNVMGLESLESPSITGATNEVVVRWFDPISKTKQYTTVQALGSIQAQGCIVSVTKDYPGIASADLAARIASRELQAVSVPLKKLKVKLDRSAYNLLPGGLFVLNFPDLGIESVAFRVGEVDYGTLTQGVITVTAIQDVFGLPASTYLAPSVAGNASSWSPPDKGAYAATVYEGIEASYRDLYRLLTSATLSALTASAGYGGMLIARPTALSLNYYISSRTGSAAYTFQGTEDFCPYSTLSAAIGPFDVSITIQNGLDLDSILVPCAAYIDNEIVQVTALDASTGVATIARGCVDTVATAHVANAPVWIFDNYIGTDEIEYFSGETVNYQPLTVTSTSVLAQSSAPTINVSITGRQNAPYPPAYPTINGTRWDLATAVTGGFTLAWYERNRLTQADQLIDTIQATITPETGTTYNVRAYDASVGTLLATFDNISGTSILLNFGANYALRIELEATRSGVVSWQKWEITTAFTNASDAMITESGDAMITETSDPMYTE